MHCSGRGTQVLIWDTTGQWASLLSRPAPTTVFFKPLLDLVGQDIKAGKKYLNPHIIRTLNYKTCITQYTISFSGLNCPPLYLSLGLLSGRLLSPTLWTQNCSSWGSRTPPSIRLYYCYLELFDTYLDWPERSLNLVVMKAWYNP